MYTIKTQRATRCLLVCSNSCQRKLHGYTVHQIMLSNFYYELTHTTLKNVEILKHSKIDKNAPTCFGLHGNHLQGAKVSTWLKVTRLVNSRCVKDVHGVVSAMAAYAAIALTTPCTSFTHLLLTKRVTFSQVLTLAPWRWFPCRPKHVGAFLSILECFNISTFFNAVCVSW